MRSTDATASTSAELDRLERCVGLFAEIDAAPVNERASVLAARVPEASACKLLFTGCEWDPVNGLILAQEMSAHTQRCLDSYCPRLDPRPQLCDDRDASEVPTAQLEAVFANFVAAKLALDLQLPRDHPRIVSVAEAIAPIWAAPVSMSRIRVSPP